MITSRLCSSSMTRSWPIRSLFSAGTRVTRPWASPFSRSPPRSSNSFSRREIWRSQITRVRQGYPSTFWGTSTTILACANGFARIPKQVSLAISKICRGDRKSSEVTPLLCQRSKHFLTYCVPISKTPTLFFWHGLPSSTRLRQYSTQIVKTLRTSSHWPSIRASCSDASSLVFAIGSKKGSSCN